VTARTATLAPPPQLWPTARRLALRLGRGATAAAARLALAFLLIAIGGVLAPLLA
jgi:hypothetical protein